MNYSDRFLRETASYSVLDVLLADIAVRIQLTPTDYQTAVDHYEAINEWIDREDSPLHGRVQLFYPQGGFMIGATIARHSTDAEFDIDVMAQIDWPPTVDPEIALCDLARLDPRRARLALLRKSRAQDAVQHRELRRNAPGRDPGRAVDRARGEDELHLPLEAVGLRRVRNRRCTPIRRFRRNGSSVKTPADEIFGLYFEKASLDYNRSLLEVLAQGGRRLRCRCKCRPIASRVP